MDTQIRVRQTQIHQHAIITAQQANIIVAE